MSAAEKISKLEGLLARIRNNSVERRGRSAGAVLSAIFENAAGAELPAVKVGGASKGASSVRASVAASLPISAPPSAGSSSTIPIEDVDIEELDGELVEIDSQGTMTLIEGAVTAVPPTGEAVAPPMVSTEATLPLDLHAVSAAAEVVTTEVTSEEIDDSLVEEVESLLEVEDEIAATPEHISRGSGQGPTMEQLGATVELEGQEGPELELDTAVIESPPADRLEATPLPSAAFPGAYDESLRPPPEAQHDLEVHDHLSDAAHSVPEVVGRTEVKRPVVVAQIIDERSRASRSFIQLLDDALRLTD